MGDIVWHGHHENDCPIEELPGTIAERVHEIVTYKPVHEHEIRLRLLKRCLPKAVILYDAFRVAEAPIWDTYFEAHRQLEAQYEAVRAESNLKTRATLYEAYLVARATFMAPIREARAPLLAPILARHALECGCTEWNGKDIVFPPSPSTEDV